MVNRQLRKKYDVVIIGASIAGFEAAKVLGSSKLDILVIEKDKECGNKPCAHGIVPEDIPLLPEKLINFPLQRLLIHYGGKTIVFPEQTGLISSINRKDYLNLCLSRLSKKKNVQFIFGQTAQVLSKEQIEVDGCRICFDFLIGADGANSTVRKFLKIKNEESEFAVQYIVPRVFDKFELFFDKKNFGSGYSWIFPNNNFTSIGCVSDINTVSPRKLRENLDRWIINKKIDISKAELQAHTINCDYQGYKFGNIFLVGDAAGLASATTGKGMYAATVSARQVANEILGIETKNLIGDWLKKKKIQEKTMFVLKNHILRKILFWSIIKFPHFWESKVMKNI